jgi:hypothetical protein
MLMTVGADDSRRLSAPGAGGETGDLDLHGRRDRRMPGARRAHTGYMGRIIGTILGAILAIWLAVSVAGGVVATLKTFLIIGLIAMAVFIVVWLVARRPGRG